MSSELDSQLTWFDRFCSRWAPGVAAGRARSRLELDVYNSYRGSLTDRTMSRFDRRQPINNGTLQDRIDIGAMRDRAADVYSNSPIGRSVLNTEVTNVVADGYKFEAKATNADGKIDNACAAFNNEEEERWEAFLQTADLRGMMNGSELMRRPYRSARRDGDGGIALVNDRGTSRLQHIPANKLVTPDGKQGDRSFIDGVEVDDRLRPVNFHVLDLDEYGLRKFTAIPAANFVYLCPELDDDLGIRGPSCYSTVFQSIERLDTYVNGVAMAALAATVFGLIIKSDTAPSDLKALKQIGNANGEMQRSMYVENGSFKISGSKDDVVQVDAKQPMHQTPDFVRVLLRVVGVPFDMPLELIGHDLSQVNFASARIGLLQYYRACLARVKFYISAWDKIHRWWISRERKRQMLGLPGAFVNPFPAQYFGHVFHHVAWDYTDPVREAQSDFLQIDMGTKSPQMVAAERGRDWEEVQVQLKAAEAWRRAANLSTDVHSALSRDSIRVVTKDASAQQKDQGAADPKVADETDPNWEQKDAE